MVSDLKLLSDEELQQNINELVNEQERRQRMVTIPGQIGLLSKMFTDDGGDPAVLQAAVASPGETNV